MRTRAKEAACLSAPCGKRVSVCANQCQSVAISGHQWQLVTINGNQWKSMEISGNQSVAISGIGASLPASWGT